MDQQRSRRKDREKKLNKKQLKYLQNIYNTPSHGASFSSPIKLYQEIQNRNKYNISLRQIKNYLSEQESYALTKNVREKSIKPHFISYFKFYLLQTDLVNMVRYSKDNDGITYLLSVLDTFSRFLWISPLKDRKGKTVSDAFETILNNINENVLYICSDKGIEYKSLDWKNLMTRYNIKHYFSTTGSCNLVERIHRYLKSKIMKYMVKHNTFRYIDVLDKLVSSYNRTIHSTTNKKPIDVNTNNQYDIYMHVKNNQKKIKKKSFLFALGDNVKISLKRTIYDREQTLRWTREYFQVARRYRNQSVNLYKLRDCTNEVMFGSFYENELQKYKVNPKKMFYVDKILKREGNKSLVTFQDFPEKCKEWVDNKYIKKAA